MSGRSSPIASAVPGRVRVRHPLLRRAGRVHAVAARLEAIPGVRVAAVDPVVGSLLALYDPDACDPGDAERRIAAAAVAVLDPGPGPEDAPEPGAGPGVEPSGRGRGIKRRINRAAKIGMMGSMALSLGALGVGKRLHAGAGAVFVALMLTHMAVHRKRLLD